MFRSHTSRSLFSGFFCLVVCSFLVPTNEAVSHSGITVSSGMEIIPTQNKPVQRLKVAILPLDLPCSGLITHSGEIIATGKSHKKKLRNGC
jgi:hypothetical protein